MEATQWMNDGGVSPIAPNHKQDLEDLISTDSDITMGDCYGNAIEQYCQELDHIFNTLDEGIVMENGKTDWRMTNMKEEIPSPPPSENLTGRQALPVFTQVKMEPVSCCDGTITVQQTQAVSELSLDTSFSPTSDLGSSCSGSPAVDLDSPDTSIGFEVYHDLIMRHLVQDIQATCRRLCIPRNPKQWTCTDTAAWLMDMAAQYHLAQVPLDKLAVDGATLCSMNIGQFVQCFPSGGETVHAQLQIWNSANDYCARQSAVNGGNPVVSPMEEPFMGFTEDPQFVHFNQRSVIQRGRAANESPLHYTTLPLPIQQQHQPEIFQNIVQANQSVPCGFGAMLASPKPCSDGVDEYGSVNVCNEDSEMPGRASSGSNIHLWQFLRELLEQQDKYGQCVRWIDHSRGIFKIEDSHALARFWGKRKNRPAMNYDKLSRSLRQYYKKKILKKTTRSQRLVYQFLHPYHLC